MVFHVLIMSLEPAAPSRALPKPSKNMIFLDFRMILEAAATSSPTSRTMAMRDIVWIYFDSGAGRIDDYLMCLVVLRHFLKYSFPCTNYGTG